MTRMKPFAYELSGFDPLQAFSSVSGLPYSLFLDSADKEHKNSRYSFIACNPVETLLAKNGTMTIINQKEHRTTKGCPFGLVKERMGSWGVNTEHIKDLPPFQGGAAGFFSYDLGRNLEDLPQIAADNSHMPDMAIGIYDQIVAHDRKTGQSWIITHANNEDEALIKRNRLLQFFRRPSRLQEYDFPPVCWKPNFGRDEYKGQIEKIIEYIRAGDIFQANMTQRFDAELPAGFNPFSHYIKLREINPAPFAAYMNLGNIRISSASPERFLTVDNGKVETFPVKGTRPHVEDAAMDKFYRNALLNSEKDKAENTMIVDLLRNDLSKVCKKESVDVTALCVLETFASVHHLVSTVRGELEDGNTALDLMRACFPGGSITGAPKIRAMEIIEELEPTRRGPYCGSMGYIGFDDYMDSNILIRTLIYDGNSVSFQAGGGITADSSADEEYQETFDKAEAIFRSFESGDRYIELAESA